MSSVLTILVTNDIYTVNRVKSDTDGRCLSRVAIFKMDATELFCTNLVCFSCVNLYHEIWQFTWEEGALHNVTLKSELTEYCK